MSFLLCMSQYIVVPILSEWLVVRDFLALDSGVCNFLERSLFIDLIRTYHVKFYSVCVPRGMLKVNMKYLLWLRQRHVNLLSVSLDAVRVAANNFDVYEPLKNVRQVEICNFDSEYFRSYRPKQFIERYLTQVMHLSISFSGYLSNVIDCIAQCCHHLRTLRLEMLEARVPGKRIKINSLINLCRSCHGLQCIDLPRCDVSIESLLSTIIVRCKRYSTLMMPSSRRLFEMFMYHSRSSLTRFSCAGVSLKTLYCLMNIGNHRYSLTSLKLTASDVMDNVMIREITNLCPHLQTLDISHNLRATSTCLVFIAIKYPQLTSFNMMGICFVDCNHLTVLTSNCRQLRELHFNDHYTAFYQSNQEGLLSIALNCPHLVALTVVRSKLTEWILLEILRNCPALRLLDISNNYLLSTAFFVTYHHYFQMLQSVNVKGCMEKSTMELLMNRYKLNLISQ